MAFMDSVSGLFTNLMNSPVAAALDPSNIRLTAANLLSGGANSSPKKETMIGVNPQQTGAMQTDSDWRLRVSLATSANYFYKDQMNVLMQPLRQTDGVIFPYTPNVSVTYRANYSQQRLTHSNYSANFYEGSDVEAITINGDFTIQNVTEGRYLLAAIYFFRSASKMWFGQSSPSHLGNPPPLLYLDGYGSHYFPHVSCVLTSFQHNMPNDVDYIEVPVSNNFDMFSKTAPTTRLPTTSNISITLQPIYSRKNLHDKFNLDKYAAGELIKGNGGFL